jgi:hypothetical protein
MELLGAAIINEARQMKRMTVLTGTLKTTYLEIFLAQGTIGLIIEPLG